MILKLLQSHSLFAKRSKCSFACRRIEYLGHFIDKDGVSTNPKKIDAMQGWPIPTNIKQLWGFLGLMGYYRRFVKGYELLSKPLTDLLRKDNFGWSEHAQISFDQLKEAMISAPTLARPDFTKEFTVETDACVVGIGTVLMQNGHPLAFISGI